MARVGIASIRVLKRNGFTTSGYSMPPRMGASYMRRYEILIQKLQRGRLYDGACFLVSSASGGPNGEYREPDAELRFEPFVRGITAHVAAACKSDLLKE